MTARRDPDAILATWLDEGPTRLPDQTRRAIGVNIRNSRQTRPASGVPWRFPSMHPYARIAAAILVVGLTVSGALYLFGGGALVGGPNPSPTPLPTATTATTPSPLATPSSSIDTELDTTTWTPFTSERYGYRDAAPSGWQVRPATRTWIVPEGPNTTPQEWDGFMDPMEGGRFWSSSVELPAGQAFEAWAADYRQRQVAASEPPACDQTKQSRVTVTIDGSPAVLRVGCQELEALILRGKRVYSFGGVESFSNTFGVSERFRALYDRWLTTIVLDPSAAHEPPPADPSPS